MESQPDDNRILQELALVYIALAYGTDEEISNEELNVISEKLHAWQDETSQTVVSALKEAMDDYVHDGGEERIDRAVQTIKERFPRERRTEIIDALMDVAIADGKFLYRESAFIGRIARMLETHPSGAEGRRERTWSLLGGTGDGGTWTPLHDLALIYVTMAHRSDDRLSEAEMRAIALKISEWVPDAHEDEVYRVVKDALEVYVQGPDKHALVDSVQSVRERVPRHQLPVLVSDLQYVAKADGRVHPEEDELIRQLADAWAARD